MCPHSSTKPTFCVLKTKTLQVYPGIHPYTNRFWKVTGPSTDLISLFPPSRLEGLSLLFLSRDLDWRFVEVLKHKPSSSVSVISVTFLHGLFKLTFRPLTPWPFTPNLSRKFVPSRVVPVHGDFPSDTVHTVIRKMYVVEIK